jgi:DNA/RNA-binding domain of Phe-tRNA-synthetase-like protein
LKNQTESIVEKGKDDTSMLVKLSDDVIAAFPEASIHFLVCEGLSKVPETIALQWKERAESHVARAKTDVNRIAEEPAIKEWRAAYAKFGLKPSKFRSSIEQLWRRALQSKIIETSVMLVNLYCYISIISQAPMGAYDLDRVTGDISIRRSLQAERFIGLDAHESTPVPANVVVYADDAGIVCFGWNWRDSQHTCLTSETSRAIIFADAASREGRGRATEAIDLIERALRELGSWTRRGVVDAAHREVSVARYEVPDTHSLPTRLQI